MAQDLASPPTREVSFLTAHPAIPRLLFAGAADILYWSADAGPGKTEPPLAAGAIAESDSIQPVTQFRDGNYAPIAGIRSMRGFASSLFAVPVRIPDIAPECGQLLLRLTTATSFRGANRRSFSAPVFVSVRMPQ